MEFESFEEIRLSIDGSSSSLRLCRICHEEEEQDTTTMETPCACSGTLKFAHRGCIQRWCDRKGSTICEICLQKFEPGYTVAPPKPRMIDVVITIRGSLEAAGLGSEPQSATTVLITGEQQELEDAVYVPVPVRENSCVHQVALMFTIVFFLRQLVIILFFSGDNYATTLATSFVIRSVCVLLPSYLVVRLISVIRKARRRHYIHVRCSDSNNSLTELTELEFNSTQEITEVTTIYHETV